MSVQNEFLSHLIGPAIFKHLSPLVQSAVRKHNVKMRPAEYVHQGTVTGAPLAQLNRIEERMTAITRQYPYSFYPYDDPLPRAIAQEYRELGERKTTIHKLHAKSVPYYEVANCNSKIMDDVFYHPADEIITLFEEGKHFNRACGPQLLQFHSKSSEYHYNVYTAKDGMRSTIPGLETIASLFIVQYKRQGCSYYLRGMELVVLYLDKNANLAMRHFTKTSNFNGYGLYFDYWLDVLLDSSKYERNVKIDDVLQDVATVSIAVNSQAYCAYPADKRGQPNDIKVQLTLVN